MQKLSMGILIVIWCISLVGCSTFTHGEPSEGETYPNDLKTESSVIDSDEWVIVSIIAEKNASAVSAASSQSQIRNMAMRNEYYRVSAEQCIDYIDAFGSVKTIPDGVGRIGSEPSKQVFVKLLKLCSDLSLIESCFMEKGIDAVPKEVTVISILGHPLALHIECDNSVWFITIDTQSISENNLYADGYYLCIYSQQEYLSVLQPDRITVYVNGVRADFCDALLLGDYLKVPVVCILQQLDENTRLFYDNGQPMLLLKNHEYCIIPDEHCLKLRNSTRNIIELPPGCFGICEISSNELYVDQMAFADILKLINASVSFERESLKLSITYGE